MQEFLQCNHILLSVPCQLHRRIYFAVFRAPEWRPGPAHMLKGATIRKELSCFMDVQFGGIGVETLLYRDIVQSSVQSRVPLPENTPARSVLLSSAELTVYEVKCAAGSVEVLGELTMTLLCGGESGEPFGFTARSSFTQRVDVPGASETSRAKAAAQILETECEPDGDALAVSIVIELLLTVFSPDAKKLVTEVRMPAAETKYRLLPVKKRATLGETNLRIRDEIAADGACRVLAATGSAHTESVQFSGSNANIEGKLTISLVAETEDGELVTAAGTIPYRDSFSAVPGENAVCRAFVRALTVTAAEAAFGVCDVEAVIGMELIGVETHEMRVLADAYDPDASFTCSMSSIDLLTCEGLTASTVRLSENLAVPKHLPEVNRPVFVSVTPAVTGTDGINGKLNVDAMLLVTAVYRCDGGFLHSFTEDVPVRLTLDALPSPLVTAGLTVLSASLSGGGRLLTLDLALDVLAERYLPERVEAVSEIVSGGEKPAERGILIYCADAGETLWDVGKRFHTPVAALQGWNAALESELTEGQQVLLVR